MQQILRALGRATVRYRWLAPYIAPLAVLIFEWRLLSPTPALADHFQFWAAGRLVASGLSPYARESWVAMAAYGPLPGGVAANTVIGNLALTQYVWLYPPQTAFVFLPFGVLDLAIGIPLLHAAVVITAIAGVIYTARAMGLKGSRLSFALTLVAISQPFLIGVRDGHLLGLAVGGATAAYVGARDRRALPLAVGAVLVSLKPHIAVFFGAALLAYLIYRREWRQIAWTALAVAAVTLATEILTPYPIAAILNATDERLALDLSNVSALARDLGGGTALAGLIVVIAAAAAAASVRLASSTERGAVAFAAALSLSLVVSPYAHDYDQLLNVPACFLGIRMAQRTAYELPFILLFALMIGLVPWILFFWYPLIGQPDRVYQAGAIGALPVLTLSALALVTLAARKKDERTLALDARAGAA